ncbi:hypothetical protein JDV02_010481 [Purpureocillium takamizusanense]|uniref:IQ calmodulin-binding motif domain protein n=1 Tax=Purpureocillium takamizusanense TaxID=2060973 RepID=A0A9Q8VGN0_9HYPO|nr:uncharacterized protein JDV02_010481 [Purpureocillium takamizusanense]UNI24756.1 hypothetical protein JDV02_010481 [Purpureocillium takamizusanense]
MSSLSRSDSHTDTMRRPSADLSDPARNLEESNAPASDDTTGMDLDLAMPPADDDVLDCDTRIYTPPPRVAARFYRPSHARRRDSAASSRRNSISSAHSRCSSMQQHSHSHANGRDSDSDQSKYVAQHLRRASFLEDRRARLADRAAHAEKVRLRAALAKAAPRGQSASEERALAAQQARERNLAEIVANCAEEVRKAKQVAELTKEKREQEVAKMKAKMEERMAEAERRREELRNKSNTVRSRGLSVRKTIEVMPQVKETDRPKMTEDTAVVHIQGWWRLQMRGRILREFYGLGLSVDGIRDTLFDTVVELLSEEKVLLVTARLLRMCGLHEGDPGSVEEMAAVRTFLSAFLILGHPNQVLINKNEAGADEDDDDGPLSAHRLPSTDLANPQLQDLIGKAKDLLINFENILVRLTTSNRYTMPPALKKMLPEAYAVFYNAFIAWKSRDSNALIEVMLMQFVELDAIFQTVKDTTDDAATALYRQSIQDSQLMLIVRIKKLAGAEKGKKMIFKAVSEARKARGAKKQTGDTKPRVADTTPGDVSATASSLVSAESQTLTPPATPASKGGSKPTVIKTGLNGLLPDNRIVVHELAINKEYQIPAEEYVEQQAVLARPLYMQMRAAMDEGNTEANFRFFILMAGNIKDKLQRLLKPGNSMYNLIGEILDPEMAERQFILGNFSYEKFFTAMGSLLPKLCAPFRDDEVKDLIQNKLGDGNLIDRVEALNNFIDVMLCDYINYLLRIAAPQLIESAAQYEAKRFTSDIVDGGLSLTVAEAAWKSAVAKVVAEVQKRDPEGINHPKSRPTAARFYAQMLVDVFTQPTPIVANQVPEMLHLDLTRINNVSISVQRIITVGAVLLQCKNLLKRDVRTQWKTEASRIMSVLEANHASLETTVDGTMAALEAGRSMPAATKTHLRALVSKVLSASQDMSRNRTEPREPVLRLLLTRLRGNILARLAPGSASEKVKAANTAGEKLAALGLSEFVERVRHISDLLDKVGAVDRAAHSPWWDAVATKIQQEDLPAAQS